MEKKLIHININDYPKELQIYFNYNNGYKIESILRWYELIFHPIMCFL